MPRKSTAFRPTLDGLEQRTALSGGGNVVVKITEGPITNSTLCVDLMAEYWRVLGASLSGVPPLAPSDPQSIYEHLQDLQRVGLLEGVALDSPDVPPATLYERTMDAMVMSYRRADDGRLRRPAPVGVGTFHPFLRRDHVGQPARHPAALTRIEKTNDAAGLRLGRPAAGGMT
jgi:hypothetical protein